MATVIVRHGTDACTYDSGYEAAFKEAIKQTIPAKARRWVPEKKLWAVSPDWCAIALRIAQGHFAIVHQVGTCKVQQQNGRSEKSPPPRGPHSVLHLLPSAPPELVRSAYHILAKLLHPDVGGSTTKMQELNQAYKELNRK